MNAQQKTIPEFIKENNISITSESIAENPNSKDWVDANHYKVKLKNGSKTMTIYFSQGLGITHEPDVPSVLNCLASDSTCESYTFNEFCDEFGYDSDSIKANETYKACLKNSKKLKKFLGVKFNDLLECEAY